MIFENQKRLFVNIRKCAGMTIRKSPLLAPYLVVGTPDNHVSKQYTKGLHEVMKRNGDHHGNEHARWRDFCHSKRSLYRPFAVARNPWDRVSSRYHFLRKIIDIEKKPLPDGYAVDSFEEFLEQRHIWGQEDYMWHRAIRGWYPAVDHVCDVKGDLKCDMMRFEYLNRDLCKYFGVTEMSRARNVTGLISSYKDVYNDKTIQIVADWYEKDIKMWKYDFDTGAQTNYWNKL